jgi:hypothetical protein
MHLRMKADQMRACLVEEPCADVARLGLHHGRGRESFEMDLGAAIVQMHPIHAAERHATRGHQHGLSEFVCRAVWSGDADALVVHAGILPAQQAEAGISLRLWPQAESRMRGSSLSRVMG